MPDRIDLKRYIRFQLSKLSARNGEHEFEHLAFELARARVSPNLLPATGPVQAGGDQGRDFESYRTYLAQSVLTHSTFAALVSDGIIVGACTLDKMIVRKIKSDLCTIFGSGERPAHVAYFCEPDLPIAKRHRLQAYCQDSYQATLDIFDGQAISDMLADRDTGWIADKYLEIPSDFWPDTSLDDQYITSRDRWVTQKDTVENYADFLDIKRGLRMATFEDEAKRDLVGWIEAMRRFLADGVPERLVQKARYEIAVAELRGRGSLDPAVPLVRTFLDAVSSYRPPSELLDAAVLTVYAWDSKNHGQSSIEAKQLVAWLEKIDGILASALAGSLSIPSADRCLLLEAQAILAFLPRETDSSPAEGPTRFFDRWEAVLQVVNDTPLFPVTHIANIFETAAALIEPDDCLRALVSQVDTLVAERAGKGAAADRARRRALNYLESNRHIAAIDELHHTKADWFTGGNIEGSILSMLLHSQAYEDLGLHIASRYYAAGALNTSLHIENERIARFIGQAAFRVADTFYAAGEGVTYVHSLSFALTAHHDVASEPHDWTKHAQVARSFAHAAIFRSVALRIAPQMVPHMDNAIAAWPLPKADQDEFIAMSEGKPWSQMTIDEIEGKIAAELGQHPFGDIGAERSIAWSAFGLVWMVRCKAERDTWLAALELAAAIQIVQVEFADADLLIIPSEAAIEVELADVATVECTQLPDNGKLAWRVLMPRADLDTSRDEYQCYLVGVALMVLEHFSIRLGVARVCEISSAFAFGNLFEKGGDGAPQLFDSARLHFA
jgi:hypothetical protein